MPERDYYEGSAKDSYHTSPGYVAQSETAKAYEGAFTPAAPVVLRDLRVRRSELHAKQASIQQKIEVLNQLIELWEEV